MVVRVWKLAIPPLTRETAGGGVLVAAVVGAVSLEAVGAGSPVFWFVCWSDVDASSSGLEEHLDK